MRPWDPLQPSSDVLKSCCAHLYELPVTTLLLGRSFHPGGAELTLRLAQLALMSRGKAVLDIACGNGTSAQLLASRFGASVCGLDLSPVNIASATARAKTAGLEETLRYVVGDAESLPFADDSFDIVICECAMCTFPDMPRALREALRVLRPGGVLALSDVLLNAAVPEVLQGVAGHVLCVAGSRSKQGYIEAITDAGFCTVVDRDATQSLREMMSSIEQRIGRVRSLAAAGQLVLPAELEDPGEVLAAGHAFVNTGGIGYGLFTARKPGRAGQ